MKRVWEIEVEDLQAMRASSVTKMEVEPLLVSISQAAQSIDCDIATVHELIRRPASENETAPR
jgi:hypothetical protein